MNHTSNHDQGLFDLDGLYELLGALCNGTITPDGAARLQQLLSQRSDARQHYIEYMDLHAALQWEVGGSVVSDQWSVVGPNTGLDRRPLATPPTSDHRPPTTGHRPPFLRPGTRRHWFLAACATAVILMLALIPVIGLLHIASLPRNSAALPRNSAALPHSGESKVVQQVGSQPGAEASQGSPVARLTSLADCRWVVATTVPKQGDRLYVGQSLHLATGVVRLEFDIGASVFLQGPADLTIVAAKQLRLERGKLMASITCDKAHGLTVFTPQGTLVDLGTEFGIEITPEGSSKVHVFRGKVEFDLPTADGSPPQSAQCLMEGGAARVDAGSDQMRLVADTGEYFVRSLDRLETERHVVAYWRFEDQPLGAVPPHTNGNKVTIRATVDSSFNGNDLYAYSDAGRPRFSGKVPQLEVPQTHSRNRACLDDSEPPPKGKTRSPRNVYTHSAFSHASPIDIQKITPKEWTIEVSAKPIVLGSERQTIVGRDTHNPPSHSFPAPARLSLEVNEQHRFAINFYDVDNRPHEAIAEDLPVQVEHWYHLAAQSDGRTLKLYIDEGDGRGYQLHAATPLVSDKDGPTTGSTALGSTALGKGSDTADWSIGRGLVDGYAAATFRGCIDEVRVSDIARQPEEFLFALPRTAAAGMAASQGK